jgi:hypothetical protein
VKALLIELLLFFSTFFFNFFLTFDSQELNSNLF